MATAFRHSLSRTPVGLVLGYFIRNSERDGVDTLFMTHQQGEGVRIFVRGCKDSSSVVSWPGAGRAWIQYQQGTNGRQHKAENPGCKTSYCGLCPAHWW